MIVTELVCVCVVETTPPTTSPLTNKHDGIIEGARDLFANMFILRGVYRFLSDADDSIG